MTKIVLTGGGTAGHVMPHIAMLPFYRELGWEISYVGSSGMEKELIAKEGLPYQQILTGKLRRYFSWQNFLDIVRLAIGTVQAGLYLARIRPDLVFSKGGFVSVPVAVAAWLLRIPVVSHESDLTPGLANRLIKPLCRIIFYAFPDTARHLRGLQAVEVGIPVRRELLTGQREEGRRICGFPVSPRTTLLIMGGSSGAERINTCLAEILPELLKSYNVVHLTGKGKGQAFIDPHYRAFEYVGEGLEHIYALADLVVCRAGANSLFELKALAKPMLLIPLEIGSRGDQVDNARSFAKQGWGLVLRETEMVAATLQAGIAELVQNAPSMRQAMQNSRSGAGSGEAILAVLLERLPRAFA